MELVIGGYAQGKLNYVLQKRQADSCVVFDGIVPEESSLQEKNQQEKTVIINHLHSWIRTQISEGGNPEEKIRAFVEKRPESVILCDEIGNGIVPVDAFEREYRERTGRILIRLAEEADEVVRVICGIGQKIK